MNVSLPQLAARLKALPGKIGRHVIFHGAELIRNKAQRDAPVDTGDLRQSIHIKRSGDFRALVRTDVPYAEWNELHNPRNAFFMRGAISALERISLRNIR